MHIIIFLFLCFSFFVEQTNCILGKKKACTIQAPKTVRVLLNEISPQKPMSLHSEKGFFIQTANGKKQTLHTKKIDLSFHKQGFLINGSLYKVAITITAITGKTTIDNRTYSGSFVVQAEKRKVLLINCIHLEEYIYCVLNTESWPGWPVEVNKVLAVTCRTYALAMIEDAQRQKRSYHLSNTNLFQTYQGTHSNSVIAKAIQETKGMIITFDQKPILAMYDSCCGGIIPSRTESIDHVKAPYLARKYACRYCKNSPSYSWQTSIALDLLAQKCGCVGKKINSIIVTKRDQAGLVQELSIKGKKLNLKITGNKAYSLSNMVKSFYFDTYKKNGNIVFRGRGLGHHIGLCQWGAREMVKKGYTLHKILQYYYPGTTLGKIS